LRGAPLSQVRDLQSRVGTGILCHSGPASLCADSASVTKGSRGSARRVTPEHSCFRRGQATKGIVNVRGRPRVNAAARLVEGGLPDYAPNAAVWSSCCFGGEVVPVPGLDAGSGRRSR
jgi:hypothetical protein